MSVYWICMGNETIQPVLQPLVNGPTVPNLKMTSDFVSTPVVCHKMLTPPNFLLPTDSKSNATNLNLSQSKQGHYHIFVGDLSPDVETHHLQAAFSQFGQTSDCKIIRDQQTLKSKGYGFVSFINKEDAETAIVCMNGQWIGNRAIRTNWAIRKPPNATNVKDAIQKPLTYEEVYNQSSPTNTTVYCGGILIGLTEELIHKTFGSFGCIEEVRVFKEKGYAFIRFSSKESAIQAIVSIHGSEINGQLVKCSWGKEPNESPGSGTSPTQVAIVPVAVQSTASSPVFYNGQRGYWTYPVTTPNYQQLSNPGFIQPCIPQNYSYGNYGLPAVQWPTTSNNSTNQPIQPYIGHQPAMVSYPPQTGFQQA